MLHIQGGVLHMLTRCGKKLGVEELTNGQSFPAEPSLATLGPMARAISSVTLGTTAPTPLLR